MFSLQQLRIIEDDCLEKHPCPRFSQKQPGRKNTLSRLLWWNGVKLLDTRYPMGRWESALRQVGLVQRQAHMNNFTMDVQEWIATIRQTLLMASMHWKSMNKKIKEKKIDDNQGQTIEGPTKLIGYDRPADDRCNQFDSLLLISL